MRQHKKFLLLIVSYMLSLVLLLVVFCCFILWAEMNAFDIFFYNKSSLHGYFKASDWHQHKINPIIFKRTEMTYNLYFHPERLPTKKKDVFRVVIIGDSKTLGLGLRQQYSIANQLQKVLQNDGQFEVIPIGLQGDSIFEHLIKQGLVQKYLEPDFTIVYMVNNDVIQSKTSIIPGKQDYELIRKLCGNNPEWAPFDDQKNYIGSQYDWNDTSFSSKYSNVCSAEIALSMFKQNKTIFFTDSISSRATQSNALCYKEFGFETTRKYNELAKRAGFRVYVVQSGEPNDYSWFNTISMKEGHLNKEATLYVANSLRSIIIANMNH